MFRRDIILAMGMVEKEHRAAELALRELARRADADRTLLGPSVTNADLRSCRDNLESTYVIRILAVFEEALRDVRRIVYAKSGPIKTYALLQQCASRQHIRFDDIANAHLVREYRNAIVHGGGALPVTLSQARQWLCTFFGWMPPQW